MSAIAVEVELSCRHQFAVELRTEATGGEALAWFPVTDDITDVAEEAWTSGVLADVLPTEPEPVRIAIEPVSAAGERVLGLDVTVTAASGAEHAQRFDAGRWDRRMSTMLQARQIQVSAGQRVHTVLTATPGPATPRPPRLLPLLVRDGTLQDLGVVSLGDGGLAADRPVLMCARAVADIVDRTEAAGSAEIGGCVLGTLLRLSEPLPGTRTRIVTVLSEALGDTRHVGSFASLQFDPEAMAEAGELAALRGRGERPLTVFHSHGWGKDCGNCNQKAECALPSCEHVSLDDYQVLEAMFPSKTTVFPIAGRRFGAPGRRPVLAVHAWRGGRMASIPWLSFSD